MPNTVGVFSAQKKDGTVYFRSSITYHGKHISLGSFSTEQKAHDAYCLASNLLFFNPKDTCPYQPEDYFDHGTAVTFSKWVMLLNFKANNVYCRNPIYLKHRYFIYYLDISTPLKFDIDDLFYYMNHKILRRGNHLFVSDYGMQVNILSRYGIKNYSVSGKDYRFVNEDPFDYRYGNIEIINRYYGVTKTQKVNTIEYTAKIHVNGSILIGRYQSEIEAAIAYNKAVAILKKQGITKNFSENYIEDINEIDYAKIYHQIRISNKIRNYITNS